MKVNGISKSEILITSSLLAVCLLSLVTFAVLPLNAVHAQSTLTLNVASGNENSQTLYGYYMVLYQNGQVIATGSTPATFSVVSGETYSIQADNYGNYCFAYWDIPGQGSSITSNPVTFTASANGGAGTMGIFVVYGSCSGSTTTSTSSTISSTSSSSSSPTTTSTLSLTVGSGTVNSQVIYGYQMVLYQNGQVIDTGYTPTTFSAIQGETYSIHAENLVATGVTYCFDYWDNVGVGQGITSNPMTFTATANNGAGSMILFAVYTECVVGGISRLTIESQDSNGNTISGYYTELYFMSGRVVANGVTPTTFTLTNGELINVRVDNSGSCNFANWSDGQTANPRQVSIVSDTSLIAVYNCGGSTSSSSGTSQLAITSQDNSGNALTGFFSVLNQSGTVMATGHTPTSFTLNNGQTYTVQVDNYGSCNFAYWADTGSTSFYRTVSISSNTSYTAVINCGASTSSTSSSTSSASSSTISSSSTKSSSSITTTSSSSTTSSSASVTTSSEKSNSSIATSSISQTSLATTSTQSSSSIRLYTFVGVAAVVIVIAAAAGLFLRRGKGRSNP